MVRFPTRRLTVGVAVLAIGLLAAGSGAPRAHAIQACYSDPIVTLSNGQQADLSATIADSSADITSVTYALSLPAGVTPTRVTYTGGTFAGKEHFVYSNTTGTQASYISTTRATTATSGVALTAQTRVTGSAGTAQASVSGQSGQALTVTVAP